MSHHHLRASAALQAPAWRAVTCAAALLTSAALLPAQAANSAPSLDFYSSAQVWGNLYTQYSSPIMGDVSFTVNGTSDYKWNWAGSGSTTTGVAAATYDVPARQNTSDPVYNIVTNVGQNGFNYTGQASVTGLTLHTQIASTTVDQTLGPVNWASSSSQNSYAYASWQTGFFIGASGARPAGSYGAIVVGITLDGGFPAVDPAVNNNAGANLWAGSSFTDTAGVSYTSSFNVNTSANSSWTGTQTVYKKLLFQYGTPFEITLSQEVSTGNNGAADFFNTGQITQIEIPFQATLITGAGEAGLGSNGALFGRVFNAATATDQNTNWDFGNNGGGFTPVVPEPETYALMLAGLGTLCWLASRRRRS